MAQIKNAMTPLVKALFPELKPQGGLVQASIVGSYATGMATEASDLDLLVVVADDIDWGEVRSLGIALNRGLRRSFVGREIALIDVPALGRPGVAREGVMSVQLLLHRESWVRFSMATKNWVFASWAKRHVLLVGEDLLVATDEPELNESFVDEFDGLPALLRQIDAALMLNVERVNQAYLSSLLETARARMREIRDTFPELRSPGGDRQLRDASHWEALAETRGEVQTLMAAIKEALGRPF